MGRKVWILIHYLGSSEITRTLFRSSSGRSWKHEACLWFYVGQRTVEENSLLVMLLWKSCEDMEICGVRKEETALQVRSTHWNSCYHKLAIKKGIMCVSVFTCFRVAVVQPQALHSTTGAMAKSEWGKVAALGADSDTTERERKETASLTRLRRESWRWRICVNVSVPHKPQFPLLSYQSYPRDNAAQMRDKEGTGQLWRVAREAFSPSL